jgi:hypothetical protein
MLDVHKVKTPAILGYEENTAHQLNPLLVSSTDEAFISM